MCAPHGGIVFQYGFWNTAFRVEMRRVSDTFVIVANTLIDIPGAIDTPQVLFSDDGYLELNGRSLPENAFEFYHPIIESMRSYLETQPNGIQMQVQLDYFNSSSGRYLFEMIHLLESSTHPHHHTVRWVVEGDDELMEERGREIQSLVNISFTIEKS